MYCGQTAGRIKMPLGTEVDLGPDHTVLSDDQPPAPKGSKVPSPLLLHPLPHVCCNQTAGWIKMRLGTEVGVGPGDIVLDGDPASLPLKRHSPQFVAHVYCGQMAGWIKMALDTEVYHGPWVTLCSWVPISLEMGTATPPFRPMSIVAKRSPISAAAELFLY